MLRRGRRIERALRATTAATLWGSTFLKVLSVFERPMRVTTVDDRCRPFFSRPFFDDFEFVGRPGGPCCVCTDNNNGQEVTRSLSVFATTLRPDDIWTEVICKGPDLVRWRCWHQQLSWKVSDEVVPCDKCGLLKRRRDFDPEKNDTVSCVCVVDNMTQTT